MLEHIAGFTTSKILTGIFIGHITIHIINGESKGWNLIMGIVGSYA